MNNSLSKEDRRLTLIGIYIFYSFIMFMGIYISLKNNNESIISTTIIFTMIGVIGSFCVSGIKSSLNIVGISILATIFFHSIITKEMIQTEKFKNSYNHLISKNENYKNTENARKIRVAIEAYSQENAKIAYDVLKNKNQNTSQDIDKVMNLINVIKQTTPELIPELKIVMTDNFMSLEEYNSLREKTLKNISLATLTNEQLVLLGSIK